VLFFHHKLKTNHNFIYYINNYKYGGCMKVKFQGCFDVTTEYIKKFFNAMFDVVENTTAKYEYSNGANEYEYNHSFSLCNGYLKDNDGIVKNATITFFLSSQNNNTETVTDGVNGIKNAERNHTFEMVQNNIIVDKCTTDENGKYTSFVKNGVYDIRIEYNGYKTTLKNQTITDGLDKEVYFTIDSLIERKIGKSTYKMCNTDFRMINISLLNEYKRFENGEIIISKNDELYVYKKINKNSLFALENGTYDIRLRNDNVNVKVIKNFVFDTDFVEKLMKEFIMNDDLNVKEVN
jgi:hypothetical protein